VIKHTYCGPDNKPQPCELLGQTLDGYGDLLSVIRLEDEALLKVVHPSRVSRVPK
jgi:hypothetical protein